MAYRYSNLGDGAGTVVDLTEDNLPPLLVLWLLFVVNPDILNGAAAEDYEQIGKKLNLTPSCVAAAFSYVQNNAKPATQNAAKAFQGLVALQSGPYQGGGSSCGALDTIMTLASTGAAAAWGA